MDIAIMIEGQDGLNWPRWQNIARLVEQLGFAGLYRSDHYTNAGPPDKDSLEMWTSLTWLASHTQKIQFGPLVAPVSFRHPSMTARTAAAIDDLSGGRLVLGMGAGWQVREHEMYGWELLPIDERFIRFEEGLNVVSRLLKNEEPSDFEGSYYRLKQALLLPRPARPGGPPILIGGNGIKRTLPLVARFADEWNGVYISPSEYRRRNRILDELIVAAGRHPAEVRRSLMAGIIYGRDSQQVRAKIGHRFAGNPSPDVIEDEKIIVGTVPQILEQLQAYEQAGVQRIMLQWLDLDDLEGLRELGDGILPYYS